MRSWHHCVTRLLSARARSRAGRVASAAGPKARPDESEDVVHPRRVATKLSAPRRRNPLGGKALPRAQPDFYQGLQVHERDGGRVEAGHAERCKEAISGRMRCSVTFGWSSNC